MTGVQTCDLRIFLKKLKVGKYANLPDEETTTDSVDSVPDVDFDDNTDEQQAE